MAWRWATEAFSVLSVYSVGIPDIYRNQQQKESHRSPKAGHSPGIQAQQHDGNPADDKGNAAEQLTFFPCGIIFRAPHRPQPDEGIPAQLRHNIPYDNHGNPHDAENTLIEIQGSFGQILHPPVVPIEKTEGHDIKHRQEAQARDEADLFVILPGGLLAGCHPCHEQHKQAKQYNHHRQNQGLVFAAPAICQAGCVIVGWNLIRKKGQRDQRNDQRQDHQHIISGFFRSHLHSLLAAC